MMDQGKSIKSSSLSISLWNDTISFTVDDEKNPLLVDQLVRSLGRLYLADLSDKHVTTVSLLVPSWRTA